MPYRLPRQRTEQAAYNRHLQDQFDATRRVPPSGSPPNSPASPQPAPGVGLTSTEDLAARLRDVAQMHTDGVLNDEEFAAAKARILDPPPAGP